MESNNHHTPEELALDHQAEILNAITDTFGFPTAELTLEASSSFESDSGDGSVSFFVRHNTGMYAVNAFPQPDGTLKDITAANLQSSYYKADQ